MGPLLWPQVHPQQAAQLVLDPQVPPWPWVWAHRVAQKVVVRQSVVWARLPAEVPPLWVGRLRLGVLLL